MSSNNSISGHQILKTLGSLVVNSTGDANTTCQYPRPPEGADLKSIVFIGQNNHKDQLTQKTAIIVSSDRFEYQPDAAQLIIKVSDCQRAMTLALTLFDQKNLDFCTKIHPTAVVSESAQLGKGVTVGAFSFIGDNTVIDDFAQIAHHVVVSAKCKIGSYTRIHSFAFVGHHTQIGSHCEIFNNTSIGSDGFGYIQGSEHTKIPQVGNVVIEDNVSLGANCTVDRAMLFETRIRKGTKVDDHSHFAHNVDVGEHNLLAGGFFIAGTSKTGKHLTVGGTVAISDHVNITDNVTLGGRSAVTSDVREPGVYTGFPLEPYRTGIKNLQAIKFLHEIRMDVKELKQKLGLSDKPEGSQK